MLTKETLIQWMRDNPELEVYEGSPSRSCVVTHYLREVYNDPNATSHYLRYQVNGNNFPIPNDVEPLMRKFDHHHGASIPLKEFYKDAGISPQ